MISNRLIVLTLLTFLFHRSIYAQNILGQIENDYSSKAPTIVGIQKVVGVPTNNFTGSTIVNIPLYTVTGKGITVPISLQYSGGGGIKVDDNAGDFGVGWSLEAGGMITRQIRGLEDEGGAFEDGPRKHWRSIPNAPYWEYEYLWDSERDSVAQAYYNTFGEWSGMTYGNLTSLSNEIKLHNQQVDQNFPWTSNTTAELLKYGILDSEPDLFHFKFGKYSGKFVFNAVGEAIITPYTQDLRIERIIINKRDTIIRKPPFWAGPEDNEYGYFIQRCLVSFKVTTPEGLEYYFGLNENDRAETKVESNAIRKLYNAWALSRVTNKAQNDSILFTYSSQGERTLFPKNRQLFITAYDLSMNDCLNREDLQMGEQYNVMPKLISIRSVKEEIALFHESNGSFFVMKDRITGKEYRKISRVLSRGVTGKARLHLISDKDLITNKGTTYQFTYFDNATFQGYNAQDAWGYYNGAANTEGMMPAFTECTKEVNRLPAWPEMKQDILTSITYPTGGRVFFEYEPHRANTGITPTNSFQQGDGYVIPGMPGFSLASILGGTRIKVIKSFDPMTGDTLFKNYEYNTFGTSQSSGHLYMAPALYSDMTGFACAYTDNPVAQLSRKNMFIGTGTGMHVGYKNVTEWEGREKAENGYIEYEYYDDSNTDSTFFSNAITDSINTSINDTINVFPSWQYKLLPENYLAGREKEKRVYNGVGSLLQREKFFYKSKLYQGFNNYVRGGIINVVHSQQICYRNSGTGSYPVNFTAHFFYWDPEDQHFARDESITNYTAMRPTMRPFGSYYFLFHYSISKNAVLLSRQIKESFASNGTIAIDTVDYLYENDSHINPTSIVSRNSNDEILAQKTFYAWDYNAVNNGDSTFHFMGKAFFNPPIASFNYKNNLVLDGGYRHYSFKSRNDSAIFLPREELALLSSETGINPAALNIGNTYPQTYNYPSNYFIKNGSYRYNDDNTISHVIKKGNNKTLFLWDYDGQYVTAQVIGADSSDIAYTSFETLKRGNWDMAYTAVDGSSYLTGKKSYNMLTGNITKNGLNSAKRYVLSYWSLSGPISTTPSSTAITGDTARGWTYYEHRLPTAATSVILSGSVIIDELRLYPLGSQMQTYTFDPVFGMNSTMSVNNQLTSYEYTGSGGLALIRDASNNIIKKGEQHTIGFDHDTAIWVLVSGIPRQKKCITDTNYVSDSFEIEAVDVNPNSPTFDTKIWQDAIDVPCHNCVPPDWQNTTNLRCVQNSSSQNTGVQEQEQKDMNPCSSTYNQTRWVTVGTNLHACPLPPPPCTGPDKMLIGGVCVTGTKRYIAVSWDATQGKFKCTYKYTFPPNCTSSAEYFEYSAVPCNLSPACVMD